MPFEKAYDSRSTLETDPLRNFRFLVRMGANQSGTQFGKDFLDAPSGDAVPRLDLGFMSVSGLGVSTDVIPYREGGDNTTMRKLPGQSNFSDLTLTRGTVVGSFRNWYWFRRIFNAVQGRGLTGNKSPYFRFTVDIFVLNHPENRSDDLTITPKMHFQVYNAWPSALSYSDLDAGGNAVLVESMTLAHEGFDIKWALKPGMNSTPGSF